MKAILLNRHGDLNDVAYGDVPTPRPGPGEVLLEVKAAALNRLDLWITEGWRGLKLAFPHIMGCDGSGVVVEIGLDVVGFAPGDRVAVNPTRSCGMCEYCLVGRDNLCNHFAIFGEHIPGFYAEYQVVPARNLLLMPESASFEDAAAASLVYVTAWHSLIEVGRFQAGEDLLIIGAGGGVNTACIDIARFAGARTIYVVGSDEKTLDLAHQLGADVTINRQEVDWGKAVYDASQRRGVDVVVDNVGAATFPTSLRALKKGGRLLTVGNTSGPIVELDNRYVFGKHLQIIGTTMGPRSAYHKVMGLIFTGRLNPAIDTIYPLSEGLQALHHLAKGRTLGKVMLRP
ncbi:MAG TPA: alcohol dehydrogenase catalytic domain-containing protein [Anaerolineae bacterium]|jgi:NADPH:quinone reductase-like Zn-dependent oxidoreductase|nr:alcohol dehydrogenase catalytic domain-containing protein [Anaerolineae bacterium]